MRMIVLPARRGGQKDGGERSAVGASLAFGQPVIQHLVGAGIRCGVDDFVVFGGESNLLRIPGVRYDPRSEPLTTIGRLSNLDPDFVGPLIITYADIIYEYGVLRKLIDTPGDIVVTVDASFRQYLALRGHTPSVTSSMLIKGQLVEDIGMSVVTLEAADAQYIGLLKLTGRGLDLVRNTYSELRSRYGDVPWRSSSNVGRTLMTDVLQEVIDRGVEVAINRISHGWLEARTSTDKAIIARIESGDLGWLLRQEELAGRPVISAGGLPVRNTPSGPECLLVGTGATGEWRIPKGLLNPNEAVESAAVREVREETGVSCEIREHLGTASWSYYFERLRYEKLMHVFLMSAHCDVEEHDGEHAAVAWHRVSGAEKALLYESERKLLRLVAGREST